MSHKMLADAITEAYLAATDARIQILFLDELPLSETDGFNIYIHQPPKLPADFANYQYLKTMPIASAKNCTKPLFLLERDAHITKVRR